MQSGEVDWWETPLPDLVPLLKQQRRLTLDIADPLGNIGDLRMNHLYPPFNDQRVRQAVLIATSQADYMQAVVGGDTQSVAGVAPASSPPARRSTPSTAATT